MKRFKLPRAWPLRLSMLAVFVCFCVLLFMVISPKGNDSSTNRKPPRPSTKQQPPQKQHYAYDDFTFPGGKRQLGSNYRFVALYGTPEFPILGALGDQSLDASITRVKTLAAEYQQFSSQPIYPAFEIIASVAAAEPTENGDYSREASPADLLPWIKKTQDQGVYVVLDLQPGCSDFTSQAKEYTELLQYPHVGLALDPEWRLGPDQVHMAQIGHVGADEINQTSKWLADLVKTNHLPQKLLLIHQFRTDMLPDRDRINTTRPELTYMIQMDGQGSQAEKSATWQVLLQNPPKNVAFGWKNFLAKDAPVLTPEQTMQISPQPWYVSYQ